MSASSDLFVVVVEFAGSSLRACQDIRWLRLLHGAFEANSFWLSHGSCEIFAAMLALHRRTLLPREGLLREGCHFCDFAD